MSGTVSARQVVVYRDREVRGYGGEPPWGPAERYPEYPEGWPTGRAGDGQVYRLVRETLCVLGLDRSNFGRPGWNPLGDLIAPGSTVLVKPNWVFHSRGGSTEALFVNASVIRPVLDYAAIALQGRGRIILADSPLQSADFSLILEQAGIPALQEFWRARGTVPLEVRDLRRTVVRAERGDRIVSRFRREGDPEGYRTVNLGLRSYLTPLDINFRSYRVTDYEPGEMALHHNARTHEYLIPNSVLGADTVINLAKLKTHRKGGITCALKNLVGINGNKDWLPHHRAGSTEEGGDEYQRKNIFKRRSAALSDRMYGLGPGLLFNALWQLRRLYARLGRATSRDPVTEGSWHGNDTLWRMVLDLNTALLYADREGLLSARPVRGHLALVDAVVAGEGDGPLDAAPRREGLLLAGFNQLAVDAVAAALIGHDPRKIPMIARGFTLARGKNELPLADFTLDQVEILSNEPLWNGKNLTRPESLEGRLDFAPAPGWVSKVELGKPDILKETGSDAVR